ncbi:uncharacterized protein PY17X_1132000 [Plasmodium yoelii]|uniref:Uncharacterized protein n=1 Tax=Plasmodium yoelii TaxID=5861 RepID=A0A077Y6D2_PLAYE|nr:uncharacterized protein PY17X_1132000 [Plasmodium yoelii]CDU19008.1 conserved Plasmodium protein, unknown function [Plasmodium yoelii]VTZ79593.1 conserved Plasmodium protein, unknown function [Plasmodium yoelii]|eukprot:XP_730223.3 uncharacterized protein PY17X_1132000 [Plasmodium yoelii]
MKENLENNYMQIIYENGIYKLKFISNNSHKNCYSNDNHKNCYSNDNHKNCYSNDNHKNFYFNDKKNIYSKVHLNYQKCQNKKNNFFMTKQVSLENTYFKTKNNIDICKKYFTEKKNNFFYKKKCTNTDHNGNDNINYKNDQLINLKKNRHNYYTNNNTSISLRSFIQKAENKYVTNKNATNKYATNKYATNKNATNKYTRQNNETTNLYNCKIYKKNNKYVYYNNLNYSNKFSNYFDIHLNLKNRSTNKFYRRPKCQEIKNYNHVCKINNYNHVCKVNNFEKNYNNTKTLFNANTNLNIINKTNIVIKNEHNKPLQKKKKKKNEFCSPFCSQFCSPFSSPFCSPVCCRDYNLSYNNLFNVEKDGNCKNRKNNLFDKCMKYNKVKEQVCYIDFLLNGEKEAKKIIEKAYKHKDNIKKYMYKNIDEEIEKLKKKEILVYNENLKKMEKEIKIYQNKIEQNLQNYILKINNIYKNIDNISKYLIDKIINVDLTFNSNLLKHYLPVKNIEQYIFTNSGKI